AGENGDGGTTQVTGAAGDLGTGGVNGSVSATGTGITTVTTVTTGSTTGSAVTAGNTLSTASTATGSTTGGVVVPSAWRCSVLAYQNGTCDCGCAAPDPDCSSEELDACETCDASGSCNRGPCPGKIDPADTTSCIPPPADWTCGPEFFRDQGLCHCGCGALDPDCESQDPAECDVCGATGSCANSICPGSIDPEDNTTCFLPENWSCPDYAYGNGLCDCGCGVLDRDCESASRDECVVCTNGCSNESCPGPIDADDNTLCTGVPNVWTCAERFYGDGQLCHCGCGAPDPDCVSSDADACDRCGFEGSCSRRECPGTIDPENNATCQRPTPPAAWSCGFYAYGDGFSCDCGCGAVDVDCRTDAIDECSNCSACGSYQCPGRVDPDDIGSCTPPPEDWTCTPYAYGDGYTCDCGCHAPDPDCESALPSACDNCSPSGGSCVDDYACRGLDPEDNSRCTDSAPDTWGCDIEFYGDGACDCGCGVRDLDCDDGSVDVCEFCDVEGSCSAEACPGSISEEDNAVCAE
ncbi:MAG TPA: hypothetical protein VFU02_16400, partial [Polyangiaceae bacterium]|nr:hypothetical protein [Polyangiaceae bacterium]